MAACVTELLSECCGPSPLSKLVLLGGVASQDTAVSLPGPFSYITTPTRQNLKSEKLF